MSTQREAIELALDALIRVNHDLTRQEKRKAINTCIQALAELGDPENIEQEAMQQVQAVIQAYTNGWNAALGQHTPLTDELLEALEGMLEYTASLNPIQGFEEYDHAAVRQACAVIAKAKGEA